MSDQKPHITASELDHILEQVQKKRADAPAAARPAQSSDADLDAILSELGVGTGKKRAPVEPILLPVPEFAHEKNAAGDSPARSRESAGTRGGA